jgi:hypothetical protein
VPGGDPMTNAQDSPMYIDNNETMKMEMEAIKEELKQTYEKIDELSGILRRTMKINQHGQMLIEGFKAREAELVITVKNLEKEIKELQGFKICVTDLLIDNYYDEEEIVSIIRAGEEVQRICDNELLDTKMQELKKWQILDDYNPLPGFIKASSYDLLVDEENEFTGCKPIVTVDLEQYAYDEVESFLSEALLSKIKG